MSTHLSDQEIQRRQKLVELRALGIDPYPADEFPVNVTAADIKANYERDKINYKDISVAGRIMSIRDMGKACFAVIQDVTGRVQLYVRKDDICPGEDKTMYDVVWKKLIDIGDIIGIKGYVFTTKTGEISIHVTELKLLSKSLKPLPMVKTDDTGKSFDEVSDPEFRFRQRYVDLIINPQVRETFIKRTQIVNSIRQTLTNAGMLEVETPILQSIPGGATARPFITHHNALDMPLYLRIANELYLKRLIVGGFEGVFEFAKDFRNEGMDRTHNPEFTILEFYVAYKDYNWMMSFTERLLEKVTMDLYGITEVMIGERTVDFKAPFRRVTMYEAIKEHTGIEISGMDEKQLREVCAKLNIHVDANHGKGKIIDAIFGEKCEGHYVQPTFITDYPVEK